MNDPERLWIPGSMAGLIMMGWDQDGNPLSQGLITVDIPPEGAEWTREEFMARRHPDITKQTMSAWWRMLAGQPGVREVAE